MKGLCMVKLVAYILVIIGALNWAVVGLFDVDVIARVLGAGSMGAKVVYVLIGLGAIILLIMCKGKHGECKVEHK
jgi:uncharacterized protein